MKKFILIAIVLIGFGEIHAQSKDKGRALSDLQFYADVMANAGNPLHRQRACDSFNSLFFKWIESDQFELDELNSIQWLSVKKPEDEKFTIATWQLEKEKSEYNYFGVLIHGNKIYRLTESYDLEDEEYITLSTDEWLGALYYNIQTYKNKEKTTYVLFGYDGQGEYEHRKIAETLSLDGDSPTFGIELFKERKKGEREKIKNRLILDYSSDSNVTLNYNPSLEMIVFDHLIPRMGRVPGQGATMLPDGSYVGYKWDGTHLSYVDKLFDHTYQTAPRPQPVIQGKRKDINGN